MSVDEIESILRLCVKYKIQQFQLDKLLILPHPIAFSPDKDFQVDEDKSLTDEKVLFYGSSGE